MAMLAYVILDGYDLGVGVLLRDRVTVSRQHLLREAEHLLAAHCAGSSARAHH